MHKVLKEEIDYPGSRELLRQTLKTFGFKWEKTANSRQVLIEKDSVVTQRFAFYDRKAALERDGFTLVYLDETWLDTGYTVKKCWQGPGTLGVLPTCNRGHRLIVVHAGSKDGFIDGAKLTYKASASTGDYHQEMNGGNFFKWLTEKLLPNLPARSAVVMDNTSYHSVQSSKCPTSSSRNNEIMEWLRGRGVDVADETRKVDLLQLARMHKPALSFVTDELLRQHGHEVLRMSPYHPEFNPIELIWAQLKSIVRSRNVTFRLDDVNKLVDIAFGEIDVERWRRACEHCEREVARMKVHDNYTERPENRIVIDLAEDLSTESNSSTETASMGSSTETASECSFSL